MTTPQSTTLAHLKAAAGLITADDLAMIYAERQADVDDATRAAAAKDAIERHSNGTQRDAINRLGNRRYDEIPERVYGRPKTETARRAQTQATPRVDDEELMRPGQRGLFWRLVIELRPLNAQVARVAGDWMNANEATLTKVKVSDAISRLRAHVAKGVVAQPEMPAEAPQTAHAVSDMYADIQNGYYAAEDDSNVLHFYRITRWKDSGRIKLQEKASEELYPVKGAHNVRVILQRIRDMGPDNSQKLFADKLCQCYRCGRDLTDAESRARGIGPICVDK